MNAIATIRKVIDSGILESALVSIPSRGATEQEIADEQRLLRLDLCPDHLQILRQWNGVDLEVIRLFGCGEDASPPGRLSENQTPMAVEGVTAIIVFWLVTSAPPSSLLRFRATPQPAYSPRPTFRI